MGAVRAGAGAAGRARGAGRTALVSGAGVAGPALAWWLERHGWQVTVLERSDDLRTAGQNIDVRGPAREVLRRMGLEEQALASGTGEAGLQMVDERGEVLASFPAGEGDSDGTTAEMEIIRGRLVRLLADACGPGVDLRLGEHLVSVDDLGDRVRVETAGGDTLEADVLLVAEGTRSPTRRLVLGDVGRIRPLGTSMVYGTIPREEHDTRWWRWYNAPGGRVVSLRPDDEGTIRALLSFRDSPKDADVPARLDADAQRALVARVFEGAGWETPRVVRGIAACDDLYVEQVVQVLSPTWTKGRVALTGDAAWCASPVSGMGTTLALTGAYVLAGELASHDDPVAGLRAYEQRMRPLVTQAQSLPPGVPWVAHPRSRAGVTLLRTGARLAGSGPARRLATLLPSDDGPSFDLPDYPV